MGSPRRKSSLGILVLRQQCLNYFRPIAKVRASELRECRREIKEPTSRREIKDAERASDSKALSIGNRDARTIIHQNKIGADRCGERNRSPLSLVQAQLARKVILNGIGT